MKSLDIETLGSFSGQRIKENETFCFQCHSDVKCFNRCCRNLNLFLYPYDVIRLKSNLNISSDEFLDRYVDVVLRSGNYFPDVLLSMTDNEEHTCPFLTEAGCQVYPDRPDACRTFPMEHGVVYDETTGKKETVHFFKPPEFCLGQYEKKEWTPASWAKDQEAETYNRMTERWAEVKRLFQQNPWGASGMDGSHGKMAFMAAYNIDSFRKFVFNSSFLKRYKVKTALLKKIEGDDVQLMLFAFSWIRLFVWGIKSKKIMVRR
jgi:hypothetical protein